VNEVLCRLLELHPLYDHRDEVEAFFNKNTGLEYLVLYMIDHLELTEHGGSVGGAWLTDKGKAVMAALQRERVDGFEALGEQSCMHGYSVETELQDCPECGPMNLPGSDNISYRSTRLP
jgi:hypothetical protein